jgi:hypothetical protein
MIQRLNFCILLVFCVLLAAFVVLQEHQKCYINKVEFCFDFRLVGDDDFGYSNTEVGCQDQLGEAILY